MYIVNSTYDVNIVVKICVQIIYYPYCLITTCIVTFAYKMLLMSLKKMLLMWSLISI